MATAEREMQRMTEYDYVVVNQPDRLDLAIAELKAIVVAERRRVCPRTVEL
jgi:guanylate kinase